MPRRRRGEVERAYQAWIDAMGELSLRAQATATQVLALARQIDVACAQEAGLAGIAVVSRELRQVALDLRDVRGAGTPPGPDVAAPAGSKADEVRAARERRMTKRQRAAAAIDGAVP